MSSGNGNIYAFNNMSFFINRDAFSKITYATLLGREFDNCYGNGETKYDAVISLKIRVNQLRRKLNKLRGIDGKNHSYMFENR